MSFNMMKGIINRINIYLINFRILDWKAYVFISITGSFTTYETSKFNIINYVIFMTLICSYLSFSFSINNVFDVDVDSIDKNSLNKNPITSGKISKRTILIYSFLIAIISLLISLKTFGLEYFTIYTFTYILSAMYSTPPLRFKGKPIIDLISHGLFFGATLFLLGVLTSKNLLALDTLDINLSIIFFLYSIFLELRNHIEDYEFDEKAKIKTTVVTLGRGKSILIKDVIGYLTITTLMTNFITLKLVISTIIIPTTLLACTILNINKDRRIDATFVLSIISAILEKLYINYNQIII